MRSRASQGWPAALASIYAQAAELKRLSGAAAVSADEVALDDHFVSLSISSGDRWASARGGSVSSCPLREGPIDDRLLVHIHAEVGARSPLLALSYGATQE